MSLHSKPSGSLSSLLETYELQVIPHPLWLGTRYLGFKDGESLPSILTLLKRESFFSFSEKEWLLFGEAKKQLLFSLQHPALFSVRETHVSKEEICFIHEYTHSTWEQIQQDPFSSFLKKKTNFSEVETFSVLRQLTKGLQVLHQNGRIHRYLHPELIWAERVSQKMRLKIMDFCFSDLRLDPLSFEMGEESYVDWIAPELMENSKIEDHPHLDFYPLGVLAWKMLGGNIVSCPEEMLDTLHSQQDFAFPLNSLSIETTDILERLIHPDPLQRFQDCDELLIAFQKQRETQTPKSSRPNSGEKANAFSLFFTQTQQDIQNLLEKEERALSGQLSQEQKDFFSTQSYKMKEDSWKTDEVDSTQIDKEIRRKIRDSLHEIPATISEEQEAKCLDELERERKMGSIRFKRYQWIQWAVGAILLFGLVGLFYKCLN